MKHKYDRIGKNYNQTRKADPYLLSRMRSLLAIEKGKTYIDMGCGTGNYTIELASQNHRLIGIDPSKQMLDVARSRSSFVNWQLGTVEKTEVDDNSVDGILASLTIHHWNNLEHGFLELKRILKPDRRLVIFTSTAEQMEGYWLNHYFPKMLRASILQMPSILVIEKALTLSGFVIEKKENYSVQSDLQDKFLYCGKHNPECYFDEQIRQGISSFRALSNAEEIQNGLNQLKKDIEDGKIENVIRDYENDHGDYLFIQARKKDTE